MLTDLEVLLTQILPETGVRGAPFTFRKAAIILTEATHERMDDWKIRRAWQRLRDDPCTRTQVAPLNPGKRCVKLSAASMRLVAAEAMHYEIPVYWRRKTEDLQRDSFIRSTALGNMQQAKACTS